MFVHKIVYQTLHLSGLMATFDWGGLNLGNHESHFWEDNIFILFVKSYLKFRIEFLWSRRTVRAWLMLLKVTKACGQKKEENSMKVNNTKSYHSKRWLQCLFTLHFHLFPWSKAVVKLLFWLWFHFLCHLKITSCSVKYSMQFTLLTQGKQKHLKHKAKKFFFYILNQPTYSIAPLTPVPSSTLLCVSSGKKNK